MSHDNYNLIFEDWLYEETHRKLPHAKRFVGDRSYRHFDTRISLKKFETNEAEKVINKLKNPALLQSHSFFPFIRRDKKVRRFLKEHDESTDKKVAVIKQKLRPIMYASHQDACIYGFYGYMLKKAHNKFLDDLEISDCVIAYRKIPRSGYKDKNKSNIDFAKDIFEAIQSVDSAAVLCVDIRDFFGSIDHSLLLAAWKDLLRVSKLPLGHRAVYKNITNYRYIFLYEALEALRLGKLIKGRFYYNKNAKKHGSITTPQKYNRILNNDKYIHKNRSIKGIPQGSPISDVLANMYLTKFDQSVNEIIEEYPDALYRRYSDDILVICPQDKAEEIYKHIKVELASNLLRINEEKTELFFIDTMANTLVDSTAKLIKGYKKNKQTIQYLGFEFDLNDIHIRSATIANYYRKMIRKLRSDSKKKRATKKIKSSKTDKYAYFRLASERLDRKRLHKQRINIRHRTTKLRRMIKNKPR